MIKIHKLYGKILYIPLSVSISLSLTSKKIFQHDAKRGSLLFASEGFQLLGMVANRLGDRRACQEPRHTRSKDHSGRGALCARSPVPYVFRGRRIFANNGNYCGGGWDVRMNSSIHSLDREARQRRLSAWIWREFLLNRGTGYNGRCDGSWMHTCWHVTLKLRLLHGWCAWRSTEYLRPETSKQFYHDFGLFRENYNAG